MSEKKFECEVSAYAGRSEFTYNPEQNNVRQSLSNQNSKAVVTGGAQAGNSGWYEYRFDISGSDLTGDGRYEITLSDKDEAGNTKTNAENPIWFYIDATKPSLDSVIGLENSIVNADSQTVSFMASDAIALSSIQVYIDDEQIQQATDFETTAYESEFQVGTGLRHRIRFVITDKAGNVLIPMRIPLYLPTPSTR